MKKPLYCAGAAHAPLLALQRDSSNDTLAVRDPVVCSRFITGNCAKTIRARYSLRSVKTNGTPPSRTCCRRVTRNATELSAHYLMALRRGWITGRCCAKTEIRYSLRIPPEVNADIELVSCRELVATSKRLLNSSGSKSKAAGCRIKRKRPMPAPAMSAANASRSSPRCMHRAFARLACDPRGPQKHKRWQLRKLIG